MRPSEASRGVDSFTGSVWVALADGQSINNGDSLVLTTKGDETIHVRVKGIHHPDKAPWHVRVGLEPISFTGEVRRVVS